jgi:hypothetical protein
MVGHLIMRPCSFDEQRKVERMLENLKRNVLRNWRNLNTSAQCG